MKKTRFIAFYSYKGGVGRSLALANLAYLLAYKGRKVLILDMDLEAPGQHRTDIFHDQFVPGTPTAKGVMELLERYQSYRDALPGESTAPDDPPADFQWNIHEHLRRSDVFDRRIAQLDQSQPEGERDTAEEGGSGTIWLMPATGEYTLAYQDKLAHLDWDKFYRDYAGVDFFEALKFQLRAEGFDDVLIDSRTGFNDVFYTTTLLLADTVVLVSGLNRQNIEGTAAALRTITAAKNEKHYGAKRIVLVGSPVPSASMKESDIRAREDEIAQEWETFREESWGVTIPYMPYLVLREEIPAMDSDDPFASNSPYVQSIVKLEGLLAEIPAKSNAERFEPAERINPFPAIRVEYWNESDVVSHFVDPGNNIRYALEQFMPTVVFGSRGTGKTMLARWFDYETIAYRLEREGQTSGPGNTRQIGLWFRLDIDLLNAFNCDEAGPRTQYDLMFGQVLDLLFLRKALKALERLGGLDAWADSSRLCRLLSREMGAAQKAQDYAGLEEQIADRMSDIRRYINNPTTHPLPFVVQGNILLKLLVEHLREYGPLGKGGHYFALFVDEYENFHAYQQRIVNTRLKQAKESDRVTYKLLARNDGIHTYQTLAKGQPLEPTHDLRQYYLDEGVPFEEFFRHIRKIVGKHLAASGYFNRRTYIEPEKLFPELSTADEIGGLMAKRGVAPLHIWVKKNHPEPIASPLLAWMAQEENPLRQAVAAVMLNQGKPVEKVIAAFRDDSPTARAWYHNYHQGALYWLYSLYRKEKRYAGFRQIVGIAGNNTRVALDLCYAIVEQWLASGEGQELPIATDIQNRAIHGQSETYFRKLVETGQDAGQIHRFVERLGRLFEIIHKGPRQSEPEINHFTLRGEPDNDVDEALQCCRTDAVLRWLPGNKLKSLPDKRRDAWQLHPRYAPYFNISWRRKKGMELSSEELRTLFFGNEKEWAVLVRDKEKRYRSIKEARARDQGQLDL